MSRITGLRQVAASVRDLDQSIAFYEGVLGLPLLGRFGSLAFFDLGGTRLLLEAGATRDANPVLYLTVGDIRAAHQELGARGVAFVSEPHVVFTDAAGTFGAPGEAEWMAFFEDPDGHLVALSSREPA